MPSFDYWARIRRYQEHLRRYEVACSFVLRPANVHYLIGLWGYSTRAEYFEPRRLLCLIVPSQGQPLLIVPKVELPFAKKATATLGIDIRSHVEWREEGETEDAWGLVREFLRSNGIASGRLAVERDYLHMRAYEIIVETFDDYELVNAGDAIERMRAVKELPEIELMRQCCDIAVEQFDVQVAALARGGYREFEIGMIGREYLIRRCAEALGTDDLYSPIGEGVQLITSGPRLAIPHGAPSSRLIGPTDVVAMDFCDTPSLFGYRIAMARVVAQRPLTSEEEDIEATVQHAYEVGLSHVRAGVICSDIDSAIRRVLVEGGLSEHILHRSGRGTGIENVEFPEIKEGVNTKLEAGMVISLEPSVYLQQFAFRVENTILVTAEGSEVLTTAPNSVLRIR